MNREELLRNLKQVREKEKGKKYLTGQLNVFDMVSDVINYLEHEEKPKMTNLEWLQKAGMITINCAFNKECEEIGLNIVINLRNKDYESFDEKGFGWLLEEYKEPIKLKQWEYDLIDIYCNCHNWGNEKLKDTTFIIMKDKGYFKGISNTGMKLNEILENCEIVSDDYEGFEDCK